MKRNKQRQIQVTIYPDQLQWIDFILETFNRTRRQTFLECFACYIVEFKQGLRGGTIDNEK